ncbi:MAG: UDP-N-acetylmuramoyl-tripeptide--D-alanyl-D-alanine ligase [Bacteroidia bacterium]|nr:UDP-N-acetylmuramoyl-tripeptide--D-alanyl-D-alanine ligase [Bacteroidia bacterium]
MTVEAFYSIFLAQQQRFTSDTRKLTSGDIFFALKGANFNGNAYAEQALNAGASYAVVDEVHGETNNKMVLVPDVLTFMQELALHHRRQFDIPVVAIAGSNGKTTTKELLISTLSSRFRTHATKGNLNNHIGVPITLLSMPLDAEVALIEIGTNSFGEIAFLCNLVEPSSGIITNIGKEHLEGFGDLEGVAREESELYHYLIRTNGFAFVNNDDVYLARMAHRINNKVTYSIDAPSDIQPTVHSVAPTLELSLQNQTITSHLSGKHNAQNIAACLSIALHLGLSPKEAANGIGDYRPSNNRSEIKTIGTNSFLMDAYNANPSSMEAALDTFNAIESTNKVVLLGDMFELGSDAIQEHRDIAQRALSIKNCKCFFAGSHFHEATKDLDVSCFTTTTELVDELKKQAFENTWFLVKASRGMKMEQILTAFNQET